MPSGIAAIESREAELAPQRLASSKGDPAARAIVSVTMPS
jgi:hypothetical protein